MIPSEIERASFGHVPCVARNMFNLCWNCCSTMMREEHVKMWSFVSSFVQYGHFFSIGARLASTVLVGSQDDVSFGRKRRLYAVPFVLLPKEAQSMDSRVV